MSSKEREGGCSFGIQRDAFSWLVEFRHGIPKRATCVTNNTKCGIALFSCAFHSFFSFIGFIFKYMYNQKKTSVQTSCSESAVCANARAYLTQNMHSIQDFVCVIRPRCDFNQKKL